MKNKKYKAVVIGCGKIGVDIESFRKEVRPATHAGAYKAHSRVELSGFADLNPERLKVAAKYFPGVPLFNSAQDLISQTKPDIVSIATYPDSHLDLVKLAARYKTSAIVCEKPIAPTLREGEEIIKACKKSGSLLFINHFRRFDPLFRKIREKIKDGKLGKIIQATYYYDNGIFNNGTHLADLLISFLGEIDWVMAVENKKTKSPHLKKDLNVDVILHFKSGAVVAIQSMPPNYGFFKLDIYGEKGILLFRNLGHEVEYRRFIKSKHYKGYQQLDEKSQSFGKVRSFMATMVDHVVKCLDGKEKPISTGEEGLTALKILFALKKSAENNGKLIKIKQ